jgi:outer membrane protein
MKSKIVSILFIFTFTITGNTKSITISQAYQLALKNSKELKASKYQIDANKEQLNQAKASLYPQIYFSSSYGKKSYGQRDSGRISTYALSISEPIFDVYKMSKIDIEKSKTKLDRYRFEIEKQDLVKRVLTLYMNILKSQNKIKVYNAYIKSKKKKVRLLNKKLSLKLSTKTELLQGEVDYHFSLMDLRKEKKNIRVNKLKLKHLLGLSSIDIPNINLDLIDKNIISQMETIIKNNNYKYISNLKIKESQAKVELSKKYLNSAKSEHLPTVNLNAQYSKINADPEVSSLENTKSISIQFQIPIYTGGATESRIEASKLSLNSAKTQLSQIEDEVKEEYEENLALFDSSINSFDLYKEALNSANKYLYSIEREFNAGLKSSLDLADAKSRLYEVKYRFVENLYDMINSYINLLIATDSLENLNIVDEIIK